MIVGVFIDPGHLGKPLPEKPGWGTRPANRSVEYDTLSDQYARFLLDEVLPEVGKQYQLTDDPDQPAICGISSGGICSWTVAWEHTDAFRKVLSHVGSFTNIRGGHVYPFLVRKTDRKPIRVFLQEGSVDLDNEHGNWPLANQQMAAALNSLVTTIGLSMGKALTTVSTAEPSYLNLYSGCGAKATNET